MKTTISQGVNPRLSPKPAVTEYLKIGMALSAAREASEDNSEQENHVDAEALEPPELEDAGDSDAFAEDAPPGGAFDRAWAGTLPLIQQLPKRLHPPVRYRIDANLTVHALDRKAVDDRSTDPNPEDLEQAVVEAIAKHIKNHHVALLGPGDWCRIPCIGSDGELAALLDLRSGYDRDKWEKALHKFGSILKAFAIELPNGDVVIPQVLIDRARRGKSTTRATALRWASRRPETTPDGASWSETDWKAFEKPQRQAGARTGGEPAQ